MRVDLDQLVRLLPADDSREFETPMSVTRSTDLDLVRAELESPRRDTDDVLTEPDRDPTDSLTVIVEWFQKLAGAEWQWS